MTDRMRTARRVVWKPQPKQALMLMRAEDEGFYGGAAGGGKSDYLIIEALRQVEKPAYRGLILRKTVPELEQLIERAEVYYKGAFPGVKFNSTFHTFTFPSGSKIRFGSLHRTPERTKYQGKQYEFIGFDELTHFNYNEYSYLKSRNRANAPGMKVYMRSTGNPGGIGHGWVKNYFVRAGTPGRTVWQKDEVMTPDGKTLTFWSSKIFIPSRVYDNKILLNNDIEYLKRLASLPEAERKALLDGDWNIFAGQVFTEFENVPENYSSRRWTHVIEPFKIPTGWKVIRSMDWGFTKPFSVGWHAIDFCGRYYRIREYYGCQKDRPDTGIEKNAESVAKDVAEIERGDPNLAGRKISGVADPAIFTKESNGTSIADTFMKFGIYFERGSNERIAGKMQMHNRLAFDDDGVPMYYVFNTCRDFIRTVPDLVYSEIMVEDVDTKQEDHIYDEARYAIMTNTIAPRMSVKPPPRLYNPLDVDYGVMKRYVR